MSSSKTEKIKGFVRYSLAHHPVCWQYREHLLRVKGWSLCLGCTGLYSGFILGTIIILLGILHPLEWGELIILAIILYLPTMLRLTHISAFDSSNRKLRISFRGSLGVGIAVGIYSIIKAPSFEIQVIQVLIGIVFYGIISYKRIKSGTKEWDALCDTCSFNRNTACPGMEPLFTWRE
ncbi:MAG: DUF2085 domain-containing protein [Candidatus Hodarchaeales archaeon]|jgi:uncharacterized membrane protein